MDEKINFQPTPHAVGGKSYPILLTFEEKMTMDRDYADLLFSFREVVEERNALFAQVREFRQKCDPREDVVMVTTAELRGLRIVGDAL